jgi:hypothetical protein
MALKFKFKSKEEIPAEHLPFYIERDGAFVLDAEGAVEKSKLDEFRQNNVALLKQVEDFKTRFAGVDPDQVRALMEEKQKLEEAQQLKAGEVEKVVENRVKTLRAELENQVSTVTAERDALNARLVEIEINQGVIVSATKRGLRPTAIPDAVSRAQKMFRLINGVPTAFESDGRTVRYGRDGITPLTLDEWTENLAVEAPHLFESNAGGGAAGNASGGGAGARALSRNPFKRGADWNVTEQMRLMKTDPQTAARLKAAA